MNWLTSVLLPILTKKKTITNFTVGDFNVHLAIMPGVTNPREFNKAQFDDALEDAMKGVLADLVSQAAKRKVVKP